MFLLELVAAGGGLLLGRTVAGRGFSVLESEEVGAAVRYWGEVGPVDPPREVVSFKFDWASFLR